MLQDFKKYIITDCKVNETDNFLLAVSGGLDSLVMTHLFKKAGLDFAVAHCNFHLRGTESNDDQQFVSDLADNMKVPFYYKDFNAKEYAANHGISVQMAARDLRYSWFRETAENNGYDYIATGHNKNDIVETMLLNVARGTGFRGLMGIRARHNNVIRPLLYASRQNIESYARANNLQWREDSSNEETKYNRNKIRHTLIPAFESINPGFVHTALETIRRIDHTGKLIDLMLQKIKEEVWTEKPDRILIDIDRLKKYPSNDILLFELLREFGVSQLSGEMLTNTLKTSTGRQFHTHSHTITRDRSYLIVTANENDQKCETLINRDTIEIQYPVRMVFRLVENTNEFKIPTRRNTAALDADRLTFPLILRGWRNGDRFRPFGMAGTKKVSDFLINIKLPLPDKKHIWILESGGEIAWVVNHRVDERFRISGDTKRVLFIESKD